jgi:hypothetical protein
MRTDMRRAEHLYYYDNDQFWAEVEDAFFEDSYTEDEIREYYHFVSENDLIEILKMVRP